MAGQSGGRPVGTLDRPAERRQTVSRCSRGGRLVAGDPDPVGVDQPQVDALLGGGGHHLGRPRPAPTSGVSKKRPVRQLDAQVAQQGRERARPRVAYAVGDRRSPSGPW